MRALALACLIAALAACAGTPRPPECAGPLVPINVHGNQP
jgi:hypothetical protein